MVEFSRIKDKVIIICPIHGEFNQIAQTHYRGAGCSKCKDNGQKLSQEDFINRSNLIHNYKYDYSISEYISSKKLIKIICPEHGEFNQIAKNHYNGDGCYQCGIDSRKLTKYEFIKRSNSIHNNKYDYSLVKYNKVSDKVKIICREHGIFEQEANSHKRGHGCPSCVGLKRLEKDEFEIRANEIHNNKYDYSIVEYINTNSKINIICKEHGIFSQTPHNHISQKQGCTRCSIKSKGENDIIKFLNENNIEYVYQKIFDNCRYKNLLRFDFYIPKLNLCIEYNGVQHYKSIDFFGGLEALNETKVRDNIKYNYCLEKNINIYIFKYDDDIIKLFDNILKLYNNLT